MTEKTAEQIKTDMREAIENVTDDKKQNVVAEVNAEIKKTEESLTGMSEDDVLTKATEWGYKEGAKDKDGNTFSPMEFLSRKPLFSRINSLQVQHRKDMDEMRKQLSEQKKDNKKIAEYMTRENEKLMSDLKKARDEALTDMDVDKVRALDKEIESVKTAPVMGYTDQDWNSSYKSFLKQNQWYDDFKGLARAADAMGVEYKGQNPDCSPDELYSYVTKEIKKEFPERFDKKKTTQKVTSANKRVTTEKVVGNKKTIEDYTSEEQRVIQNMARATGKTPEEYLNRKEDKQ